MSGFLRDTVARQPLPDEIFLWVMDEGMSDVAGHMTRCCWRPKMATDASSLHSVFTTNE
jgi:hypothetical protein